MILVEFTSSHANLFPLLRVRNSCMWGQCQNDIITVLYDQEYMEAVREKLKIIEAFKAELPV